MQRGMNIPQRVVFSDLSILTEDYCIVVGYVKKKILDYLNLFLDAIKNGRRILCLQKHRIK